MRALALTLMVASGFAGLGYQIVWTQQSAIWLGHEAAAMLAIVAAFFGGLGLGALSFGRIIDASARPGLWYAGCEAVIGLWGLALVFLMDPASRLLMQGLGPEPAAAWHWTVAFGGTFLLLLPATAAMGATLPAMERIIGAGEPRVSVAWLYAANTFGAVLGVLASAFVLVPWWGLTATAALCVAANLLCALIAWRILGGPAPPWPSRAPTRAPLLTLAMTGLLGIGYEVLVVRVLSQVAENTIYTFAILLAVYLVGTAAGAAAYSRWGAGDDATLRNRLLRLQVLACAAGILCLAFAEPASQGLTRVLGPGLVSSLLVEFALAMGAFLLPTLVMGALFSHLLTSARRAGAPFGVALGINTLAAALAPMVFGVALLPALGTTFTLLLVAAGYLLLVTQWRSRVQLGAAAALTLLLAWRPPLAAVSLAEGGKLLSHAEGVAANVSVVEDAEGVATLHINNRQQEGSSATQYADARQALLPLLLQPAPARVLFLGLGTGATARAAVIGETRVDVVELLPEVIAASALFAQRQGSPAQAALQLRQADARRFVRVSSHRYDVIVADNFHPARSGSASLYTREHFAAVRGALSADGVFCQWLPLHQLDLATLRSIVATFRAEFPHSWALLATHSLDTPVVGLVARRDGHAFDLAAVRAALMDARATPASAVDLGEDLALLGSFIAGPASLAAFSAGAPLNTDDHPVVAYLAPRITYEPDSTPRARLLELLGQVTLRPEELLAAPDPAWTPRLARYWDARDRYLAVGSGVRPTGDVATMLAQVRAPLLGVLEISPDFRPAYDPLVRMALALGRSDIDQARGLLDELAARHPDWQDASLARAALTSR